VTEIESLGGFGDALWFIRFECQWFCGGDGAESAGAGTTIASDHEGRSTTAPTFPVIGASGALADRVEFQIVEKLSGF